MLVLVWLILHKLRALIPILYYFSSITLEQYWLNDSLYVSGHPYFDESSRKSKILLQNSIHLTSSQGFAKGSILAWQNCTQAVLGTYLEGFYLFFSYLSLAFIDLRAWHWHIELGLVVSS